MATRCEIGIVRPDGTVDIIECVYDGNLLNAGQLLANRYNSFSKAESLISSGGTIKSVSDPTVTNKSTKGHHFDNIDRYKTHIKLSKDASGKGLGIEYFYLFNKTKWVVACINNDFDITQSLSKILKDPDVESPDAKLTFADSSLLRTPININAVVDGSNRFSSFRDACVKSEDGDELRGLKLFAAICYMINKSVSIIDKFHKTKAKKLPIADKKIDRNNVWVSGSSIGIKLWGADFEINAQTPNDVNVVYYRPKYSKPMALDKNLQSQSREKEEDKSSNNDQGKENGSRQTLDNAMKFNMDEDGHTNLSDISKYFVEGDSIIGQIYTAHLQDLASRNKLMLESNNIKRRVLKFSEFKLFGKSI